MYSWAMRSRRFGGMRGWTGAVAASLLLTHAGCRAALRYPVEPPDPARPAEVALLEGMNPYLLTNLVSDRLVVEVDWVGGFEPDREALQALQLELESFCAAGKRIEIVIDDEIPPAEWEALPGEYLDKGPLLARYLDHDPGAWEEADLAYLVYAPGEPAILGWTTRLVLEWRGEPRVVPTVFLFPGSIRREAELWITPRKVERALLVHEAGHLLGLVSNPEHRERDNPGHCTEPRCVMAHYRTRSQLYNAVPAFFAGKIPDDFGDRCRADIERVKAVWGERAREDAGFAQTLIDRRRADDLHAEACWHAGRKQWGEALRALNRARELRGEGAAEPVDDDAAVLELFGPCPPQR